MKFSLNTLKGINRRYGCADDIAAIGGDALIEKINGQLGAIDEVVSIGDKYQGIVIAKVVACEKHPNADKLQVCLIDDGGKVADVVRNADGFVEVVCGAPNAREGLTVAWLPPGATVPETVGKDPFVLEARELRGVVSNGMLASPKELALGDRHDGILEIDGDREPGSDFAEVFGLKDDVVFDIENKMFTHRPDLFGFLGISRELAGIQGMPFKSPEWYSVQAERPSLETEALPLDIKLEGNVADLVPRFTAIVMHDVQVGPSPVWLQVELAKVGQKSINNIVDYTNWFMLETGQPLHAYDYDKVKALSKDQATIVVRQPQKGETIKLLNGKEIEPRAEAIMIATDKQLIGIGGVMGGSETEVDKNTQNIILECANFDMYSIRRTSMAHGLFTDAVTRFTKGQSPLQNPAVLTKIVNEIREYAGGKVASSLIDILDCDTINPAGDGWIDKEVQTSSDFINSRLGLNLNDDEIIHLLSNVEFGSDKKEDGIALYAPFWRTDIEIAEDIVEEVGRLYGYDKLPLELPARDVTPTKRNELFDLRAELRAALSRAGANEVLTYSFVHGDLLKKVGQDPAQAYEIANALSPDLQYYRLSLTPSLLDKVHANNKAGYDKFAIFELGKAHTVGQEVEGVPIERERLALVVTANKKAADQSSAFYDARQYAMQILYTLGIDSMATFEILNESTEQATTYYQPGRAATIKVNDTIIGRIGEYKASVRKALKLPDYTAGFELGLKPLLGLRQSKQYVALPRFPKVTQDITLKVPVVLSYQQLFDFVLNSSHKSSRPERTLSSLGPIDIFQKEDEPEHKRITLRFTLASHDRTLTDEEVNRLLDEVAAAAQIELQAERI